MKKIIEVKKVNKMYGNLKVLDDVSFSVKEGTIHGFVGPNGAGKSTILKILGRLVLPSSGEVYIEEKSIINDTFLAKKIGFMLSEETFPFHFSVEDYVIACGYLQDVPKEEVLQKLTNSSLNQFR